MNPEVLGKYYPDAEATLDSVTRDAAPKPKL